MIAAWMLCVVVLGALLLAATFALDTVCVRLGRPRRWLWAGAMVAMCIAPFVPRPIVRGLQVAFVSTDPRAWYDPFTIRRAAPASNAADGSRMPPRLYVWGDDMRRGETRELRRNPSPRGPIAVTGALADPNVFIVTRTSTLARFDRPLLLAWGALSLAGGVIVLLAVVRLARAARRWTRADEAMHADVAREAGRVVAVWRSRDLGPAAFGLRTLQVVVPRWIDDLADRERVLMLAHEASHVRARDPQLLAGALVLAVLLPWHLPLLVAYRRLCRAVEHDCDARVLARHGDARGYGRLLVRTAEWLLAGRSGWRGSVAARWILAPVPAFAAPTSELEARLRALVRPRAGWRSRLVAGAAGGCAMITLIVACAVPLPMRGSAEMTSGVGALPPSLRDSVRVYARATSFQMRTRMEAVKDSLIDIAARQAIPALDTLSDPSMYAAFVLLDDDLRPVDARLARRHEFAWSIDFSVLGQGRMPEPVMATPDTPARKLRTDAASWTRAFPLLDAGRISEHGGRSLRFSRGTVAVQWARLTRGDSTSEMVFRAAGIAPRIPAWFRTVATGMASDSSVSPSALDAALERGLRNELRWRVPEALDTAAAGPSYVWLVLDGTGDAIAHATGRAGLGVKTADFPAGRPYPRATDDTPDGRLTIDAESWRARFPTLRFDTPVFGWRAMRVGPRTVNVLWAITDLSLVASPDAASRAGAANTRETAEHVPVARLADLMPPTLDDSTRAARLREMTRAWDRTGGTDKRLTALLRAAIADARPELLRGRRTDADFVWLVFDSTARIIAADTGRAGLGVTVDGWRDLLPTPRATARTARDSLVLDGAAFRAKFGDRIRRGDRQTWQGLGLPNGSMNVIWTVAARD